MRGETGSDHIAKGVTTEMKTSRRAFLGYGITAATAVGSLRGPKSNTPSTFLDILRQPNHLTAYAEDGPEFPLKLFGGRWRARDVEVYTEVSERSQGRELSIKINSPQTSLTRVHLRWSGSLPENFQFLGDQWERAYGDLEWRGFDGDRIMPWYFIASNGRVTHAYGVKTGATAFCFWQVDPAGISLWLDVHNGGRGVRLGERQLAAAEVVAEEGRPGSGPFQAARKFCRRLCESPRLPAEPVYGSNNWYYLYGENMTEANVLRDVDQLAELSPASSNRPYMVIDMGWGKAPGGAGPWAQDNSCLPDMPALAAEVRKRGVRPAIWVRPLLTVEKLPEAWRLRPNRGSSEPTPRIIDPSIPEALEHIQEGLRGVNGWGFELIKHDFSTFDLLGRWGFQMGAEVTADGWHFADRSRTTAEIVLQFYRAIREAVGNTILIGCNTVGHIGAGIFEIQRIGDDVSGRDWNRTRRMGVNVLGFRLPQHRAFFLADPDCVPVTKAVPFEMTRQWCGLVTRSGTVLFISADPAVVTAKDKTMLKAALAAGSQLRATAEPLDWMEMMSPSRWKFANKRSNFHWFGKEGANPFSK
jgi:alpha-galactosidase